ncbi:MAG TPA: TraB/GumN family protein [Sphingomicrobium sp.]|nr:TraB/GumN family protein [Sphingomicrobium sp.]
MVYFLIAAAIAAASVPPALAPAGPQAAIPDADPAIWVVNDHDTVIYLFGTFHALDGKSAWFNDEVETAFAASDELVLETIVPERKRSAMPSAAARRIPGIPVTPSASFLASTRMAISAGQARGMKADFGADTVLRRAAEASGKPVRGLESFITQLNMFGRIPAPPAQGAAPKPGTPVHDPIAMENLAIVMGQMQSAWNRGDNDIFTIMLDQMRTSTPESYDVMFTQRNSNWAGWIAERLEQPGTVFVAVGAGHLAGSDSVQAKLAELGIRSARIN